jgi:hypothetical protein
MSNSWRFVFAALCTVTLSGCQSADNRGSIYNTLNTAPVDEALIASAEAAQKSLLIMEQSNNYKTHIALTQEQRADIYEQASYIPIGLDTPITMSQRLPIQKTVGLIADMTGYSLVTINPPKNDISESVNAYARPALEVLRDLGVRLANKATIRIIPNTNTSQNSNNGIIQLIYPAPTGAVQ